MTCCNHGNIICLKYFNKTCIKATSDLRRQHSGHMVNFVDLFVYEINQIKKKLDSVVVIVTQMCTHCYLLICC